jgi:hypothetical protein
MANQNSNQQQQQASTQSHQTSTAALQASASALASLLPQSTNLHQLTAALVQNSKLEYNNKIDDEPTDLSTSNSSGERKYIKNEADCYP